MRRGVLTVSLVLSVLATGLPAAHAAEIRVLASAGVREALQDLVPAFESATGHKVTAVWSGTEAIVKRVTAGEAVDVVVISAAGIDRLISDGKLAAGSRADVAKSGVAIGVRPGLPRPDVSSAEAVKQAVLAAGSVAYSSGPSGFYVADLFQKMGIAERIKGKVTQTPSGVQVADLLARGEVDLGFQQVSEFLHAKGIQYLGPLPAEIQHYTVFSAGLHRAAEASEPARALIRFLTAPAAQPFIRKAGMEPG